MDLPQAPDPSPSLEEGLYPFPLSRMGPYIPRPSTEVEGEEEELRAVLRQREQDLYLAAELGKALLERSQELGHQKEILEQELEEALQRLHQERVEQRRKLEAREIEWEERLAELERELREQGATLRKRREAEWREARELVQHKQRLEEQLGQTNGELQSLRNQLQARDEASQDRTLHSEQLARIKSLQAENQELAVRVRQSQDQTRSLAQENVELRKQQEALQDQLSTLERVSQGQLQQVCQAQRDLEELRSSNESLKEALRELREEARVRHRPQLEDSLHSEIRAAVEPDTLSLSHVQAEELSPRGEEEEEARGLRQAICASNPDQALQQAIHSRDEAIRKKQEVERELRLVQTERDSLSRELLQTLRQKVELSQELEAWQEDLQVILTQQLEAQQQREVGSEPPRGGRSLLAPNPSLTRDPHRFLSLFRKS
ncbi:BICD family-like cargo adapter 2 [Hypanus sabinus]|uniref:BICD family-like cargo adapter 2 n=1 Tax=Hypanus sabinus TaxID=79690 RepID=UPI0028C4223A|nr:BICD family-like cargo adapter 2 [Hypanus sabinus]